VLGVAAYVVVNLVLVVFLGDGLDFPDFGSSRGSRRRLPKDPDQEITDLWCPVTSGNAPWMPGKYADPASLRMSSVAAWIVPPGLPRRIELDLTEYHLVHVNQEGALRHRGDVCVALIAGPGYEFAIRGSWLAIAWLGHLAGWPDPGRECTTGE
jgi:hypothetical protein